MNVMFGVVVQATLKEEKKLMVENANLKKDIEKLKKQLLEMENSRGGIIKTQHTVFLRMFLK